MDENGKTEEKYLGKGKHRNGVKEKKGRKEVGKGRLKGGKKRENERKVRMRMERKTKGKKYVKKRKI